VFDARRLNLAEFSCPFHKESFMAKQKTLVIRHGDETQERKHETVEAGLKALAKEVGEGKLELPFVVEFTDPQGAKVEVTVESHDAIDEVARQGFMF
jgi:hypothetical protein